MLKRVVAPLGNPTLVVVQNGNRVVGFGNLRVKSEGCGGELSVARLGEIFKLAIDAHVNDVVAVGEADANFGNATNGLNRRVLTLVGRDGIPAPRFKAG